MGRHEQPGAAVPLQFPPPPSSFPPPPPGYLPPPAFTAYGPPPAVPPWGPPPAYWPIAAPGSRRGPRIWLITLIVVLLVAGATEFFFVVNTPNQAPRTSGQAPPRSTTSVTYEPTVGPTASTRTLSLPTTFDGLVEAANTDTVAKDVIAAFTDQLGSVPSHALAVTAYRAAPGTKDSDTRIAFAALPIADAPRLQDQFDQQGQVVALDYLAARVVTDLAHRNVPDAPMYQVQPGPAGNSMLCESEFVKNVPYSACLWADQTFVACTVVVDPPSNGSYWDPAIDLRNVAEH